jgi:hypothetical protein
MHFPVCLSFLPKSNGKGKGKIASCSIKPGEEKEWRVAAELQTFFTLTVYASEWVVSRPSYFTPRKRKSPSAIE